MVVQTDKGLLELQEESSRGEVKEVTVGVSDKSRVLPLDRVNKKLSFSQEVTEMVNDRHTGTRPVKDLRIEVSSDT